MLTASHLPANMNGINFAAKRRSRLSRGCGFGARSSNWSTASSCTVTSTPGQRIQTLVFAQYIARLSGFIRDPQPLTLVVDAGNGMAGSEVQAIMEHVPSWQFIPMYFTPDGHFPHHVPNPLIPDDTRELQAKVPKEHANVGIAFDGDADRVGFVDEGGQRIHQDIITALLAEYFLTVQPGSTIVYDLRSSHIVPETITRFHGTAVRSRVGHSFIKEKMREVNAVFAGELSGHYYYRDLGYIDDAMLTMILMLNILARKAEGNFQRDGAAAGVLRDR